MANTRSQSLEMIDTAIELSQATTPELIMSQLHRFSASIGQQRKQPPPPTPANDGSHSRLTVILSPITLTAHIYSTTHRRDPTSLTTTTFVGLCVHRDPLSHMAVSLMTSVDIILIPCGHFTLHLLNCLREHHLMMLVLTHPIATSSTKYLATYVALWSTPLRL
jgi:hypothetical protein